MFTRRTKLWFDALGLQAEGQAGLQRTRVAFRNELVLSRTTLLLRGLSTEQVTEARGAANELALWNEWVKTERRPRLGKDFFRNSDKVRAKTTQGPAEEGPAR